MRFMHFLKLMIPAIALILMGFSATSMHSSSEDSTIYDHMEQNEDLELITQITTDSEMHRYLHHDGPYTMLAPTDAALDELPSEELTAAIQDNQAQRELMENHMFQGEHTAEDIAHVLEDGEVVEEIQAENGVLLIIDTVVRDIEDGEDES